MKHHDGYKRINKVDGMKRRARRRFHKAVRRAGKHIVRLALSKAEV